MKIKSKSPVVSPIQAKLDELLKKPPTKTSFWETSQGKAVVFALNKLKEDIAKKEGKVSENVGSQSPPRQTQEVKSFFQPDRIAQWRRSHKPAPGSQRQGRLKRVDTNAKDGSERPRKPLGTIDQNNRVE